LRYNDAMNELIELNKIKYEVISGSHAYGTNVETSDQDIRGIFMPDKEEYISIFDPPHQVNDVKNDIIYYSIKRFFNLVSEANPNIIELLWIPDDCILKKDKILDPLFQNRKAFITKKAYTSHSCYAKAQIKKAKGCNKRVNNPQPEKRPSREDFCFLVPHQTIDGYFSGRPIPINDLKDFNLKSYHVSKMEHSHNSYRLYDYRYDSNCQGVFKNGAITCQSIPIDDENKRFTGILIFNKDQYEKSINEWHNYWDWMKNRNDARWIDQESGLLTYDAKNMLHCYRLLLSSKNILENGEPIVRFDGDTQKLLLSIRNGEFEYDYILSEANKIMEDIDKLYEKSNLPECADMEVVNNIFKEIYR
jgi:predicted nucleotidyltransferase